MKIPTFRNLRPSKAWIAFGVALLLGLLAALVARSYLSYQMEVIENRAKGKLTDVIVAKVEILKGTRLSSSNLAVRAIPTEYAHSSAVTPDSFARIDGEVLAYSVKGGETIMWGLMESKKAPTFSARVEAGHRAMTVPVDEINSISGMLEPGDMIDLMVTADQQGRKITFPLLERVQVMATGQRSVDDPVSGERRQYSTVTLDTTPEQAQNVIVAREVGKLTALLRNPQDKQPIDNKSYDIASLLGLKGASKDFRHGDKEVPVLYGGSSSKLAPEGLRLDKYTLPAGRPDAGGEVPIPAVPGLNKLSASTR